MKICKKARKNVDDINTNLGSVHAHPWLLTIRKRLPQRHPKHPCITGVRKLTTLQTLRRAPVIDTVSVNNGYTGHGYMGYGYKGHGYEERFS